MVEGEQLDATTCTRAAGELIGRACFRPLIRDPTLVTGVRRKKQSKDAINAGARVEHVIITRKMVEENLHKCCKCSY